MLTNNSITNDNVPLKMLIMSLQIKCNITNPKFTVITVESGGLHLLIWARGKHRPIYEMRLSIFVGIASGPDPVIDADTGAGATFTAGTTVLWD